MEEKSEAGSSRWTTLALLALATLLRLWAARGDLWLDEVWTWRTALALRSLADILAQRDENNHPINTLFFYLFGPDQPALIYRLPAVAAGVATVVFMVQSVDVRARRTLLLLAACSYPLIHYGSEARGYSYVLLAAALCFWALAGHHGTERVLVYWTGAALGFLSHAMFILAYAPLVVLTLCQARRQCWTPVQTAKTALRLHLVPGLIFLGLYLSTYAGGFNAQGDMDWRGAVKQMASLLIGGPAVNNLGSAPLLLLGVLLAIALVWQARRDPWVALFYAVAIIATPAVVLVVLQRAVVYPRYFLVSVLFLLLLASPALVALAHQRFGRVVQAIMLVAIVGGNLHATSGLLRVGRGNHRQLIDYMAGETAGARVRIGSDHNFRTALVLEYYDRQHYAGKDLVFVPWQQYVAADPSTRAHIEYFYERVLPGSRPTIAVERSWTPPEWFIVTDLPQDHPMQGIIVRDIRYRKVRYSPSVALSGQAWLLMQRVTDP